MEDGGGGWMEKEREKSDFGQATQPGEYSRKPYTAHYGTECMYEAPLYVRGTCMGDFWNRS